MRRLGLTVRQYELLIFIKKFCEERGYSPSYQEIADALGYANKGAVFRITRHLHARGYIRMEEGKARSILVLVDPAEPADTVPQLRKRIIELTDELNRIKAELTAARRAA